MKRKLIITTLLISLLTTSISVSASGNTENIRGFEDSISTYGNSIPTGYFDSESANLTLNANSSTYSKYIIYNKRDDFEVYLTTDPSSPNFVLQAEAFDCKTNKLVDSGMLMMFQQDNPNYYAIPIKKEYPEQQCYFKLSNLSNTKGTFRYLLY